MYGGTLYGGTPPGQWTSWGTGHSRIDTTECILQYGTRIHRNTPSCSHFAPNRRRRTGASYRSRLASDHDATTTGCAAMPAKDLRGRAERLLGPTGLARRHVAAGGAPLRARVTPVSRGMYSLCALARDSRYAGSVTERVSWTPYAALSTRKPESPRVPRRLCARACGECFVCSATEGDRLTLCTQGHDACTRIL